MANHIHHTNNRRAISSPSLSLWLWLILLAAPLVVRFLLALIDSKWWGLNQLAFAPEYYAITLASLSALSLLWVIFGPSSSSKRIEQVCGYLVSNRGAALAAVASAGILWLLSTNSHLFASGYDRMGNLAQRTTPFVHAYEYLATQLTVALYQLTSGINDRALDNAALVFRLTSVLSGAGSIWLWLSIIRRLGKTHQERTALFAFLFFGGATILFLGAGELQAPAVLYVSLLIWLSLALLQSTHKSARLKYAFALAACIPIGPLYLAQLVFFVPPTLFILGIGLFPGAKGKSVWAALFFAALLAVVFYVYHLAANNLWVEARLALLGGKPPEFNYSLFSPSRILDLANSAFVLWPIAPALLWLCLRYSFSERADHIVSCLGALAGAGALWIFIADFPGGAAREITTLAPFSIPALVLAGYLWNKRVNTGPSAPTAPTTQKLGGALLVISVASFLSIVPAMNSVEGSVKYLDHDYQRRSERYLAGLIDFRDHYFFVKDFAAADRWERSFKGKSEVYLDHDSVLGLVRTGQQSAALRRLEFLLATNPHWAQLRATQAGVFLSLSRPTEALESILKARELAPANSAYLISEGDIWRTLGAPDSARERYETAYRRENNNPQALMRMGMMAYEKRRYEQANTFAYLLYESDFSNMYSYLIIGLTAYQTGETERAQAYLSYVRRIAPNIPEAALVNDVLNKLKTAGN